MKWLGYGPLEISKQGHDTVAKNYPDYTLLPGKPQKWFLEAKRLDLALQDGEAAQAVNYANNQGAEWAVLTNGRKWYIYNAHLAKPLPEKRVLEIGDLFADDKSIQILTLLSKTSILTNSLQDAWIFQQLSHLVDAQLKTPNSEVRRLIRKMGNDLIKSNISDEIIGKVLMFTAPDDISPKLKTLSSSGKTAEAPLSAQSDESTETNPDQKMTARFYTFDEIAKDITLATYRKPEVLLYGDGRKENVKSWADVAQLVVKAVGNHYTLPALPFSVGNKGKNFFLNNTSTHGSGKQMGNYRIVTINSQIVYVDTNRSTLNICASILALFKSARVPLIKFKVSIE